MFRAVEDTIDVVANFEGIISLAIQVAEILDKAIDGVRTTDEIFQHIAVELRATAYGLKTLQIVLNEDLRASPPSDEDRRNFNPIIQQRDKLFGQIAVSLNKMGLIAVLDPIDQHQRRL